MSCGASIVCEAIASAMAFAAGKALMELRVAMCQTGAGSAGVRCVAVIRPRQEYGQGDPPAVARRDAV